MAILANVVLDMPMASTRKSTRPEWVRSYRQKGKKLVPPLLDFGIEEVSWIDEGIPELVWIAALCAQLGPAKAARVGLKMARTARDLAPESLASGWFGFASDYLDLDSARQAEFHNRIRHSAEFEDFRQGVPFIEVLGPAYPLVSWYPDAKARTDRKAGQVLLNIVDQLFDQNSSLATFCCSTLVYIGFCTDKLKVASHLKLASFPEVEKYPETLLSRQVASGCRATFNLLVGQDRTPSAIALRREFWRRLAAVEPRPKAIC